MKHPKTMIVIGSIVALGAIAGVGFYVFGARPGSVANYFTVSKTDLTELVKTTGKVKAAAEVDLAFERGGRVVGVPVKVGETVKRGALLVALDASDARSASDQANAALSAAQIALEKMKRPPEALDLMVAENAVAAASDAKDRAASDAAHAEDNASSASDNAVMDMTAIVSGLKDILHSNDLNSGQDNIDYYADTARVYDAKADAYRTAAETSYQAAKASLEEAALSKQVNTSYDMTKAVAAAAKSSGDLINLYIGKLTEKQIAVPSAAVNASAAVSGYVAKANNDFAALSSAQTALTSAQNAAASSARTLGEKQEALAKLQAGAEDIDIRAMETRVSQALAAADGARAQLTKTVLRAPFDGMISRVETSVGELAAAGMPAVSLVSDASYEIDALVSETDIANIAVGSKATVTLDTFGNGETFGAVVTTVDPAQTIVNGIGAYGVKLQFVKNDERVKSGMTANIAIETMKREGVIAVPGSAIITRGGDKFVLVDNGTPKPAETRIVTGIAGADKMIEVVSGLKAGDKVVSFGNN